MRTVIGVGLALALLLGTNGCCTLAAIKLADKFNPPSSTEGFIAVGRFDVGAVQVQLAAHPFRCRATIVGDGEAKPEGCALERILVERLPGALLEGDEPLGAYTAEGAIPAAVVLVRRKQEVLFVTREPDGTWSRHAVSTFDPGEPPSGDSTVRGVLTSPIIILGVIADIAIIAAIVACVVLAG
jgi:hypothetical protein